MPRINIPPLTRACLILCLALSILSATLRYSAWTNPEQTHDKPDSTPPLLVVPFLTVVPSLSIVYPWTIIIASLVEQNIFTLTVTLATLFYGGKYLERAWGSAEFGKFLLVVSIIPNTLAFIIYTIWFAVTGNVERSFTAICGAIAIQAGFLVAFKQLVPEYTVTIFKGIIKIRVKHFPVVFLLINTISGPVFGTDVAAILAWLGFLSSWTYLRFYKRSFPDLGSSQAPSLKGDASETFAMAYFFPEPLHRPVAIISDAVFNILVAIKICSPFSVQDITISNSAAEARGSVGLGSIQGGGSHTSHTGRTGSARAEAERKRELALKALDQRLHAATNKATVAGGSSNVLGGTNLDTSEPSGSG